MLVFIEWVVGCKTRVDKSREDNRSLWSALKKDVILSALKDMGVSAKDGDIHIWSILDVWLPFDHVWDGLLENRVAMSMKFFVIR